MYGIHENVPTRVGNCPRYMADFNAKICAAHELKAVGVSTPSSKSSNIHLHTGMAFQHHPPSGMCSLAAVPERETACAGMSGQARMCTGHVRVAVQLGSSNLSHFGKRKTIYCGGRKKERGGRSYSFIISTLPLKRALQKTLVAISRVSTRLKARPTISEVE
jgi:hypothetical protein